MFTLLAPYIPPIDPSNASDTQNFDDTFLDMEPVIDDPNENEQTDTDQEREQTDTDRTDGEESNTTPSQSRSPSVIPPADDSVDVFDGYSFKGRHSILIDSDGDESEEDEEDEDASVAEAEILKADVEGPSASGEVSPDERTPEPKTPEAHQPPLPEAAVDIITAPTEPPADDEILAPPRPSKEESPPESLSVEKVIPTPTDSKRPKPKFARMVTTRPAVKASRVRREKSGVPALDRDLSDTIDEDEETTEKEDEDEDWDIVEAADGEDRNGAQGNSLFARGVVDRYRLAVFRKASTPVPASSRSFSGASKASDLEASDLADSPTPTEKQRRGRAPGLTFRKRPRQFLRPKSPHSKKSSAAKSLNHSTSASLSVSTSSSPSMLTPSPSMSSALPVTPSLKSKESHASSVGTHSGSSDQSPNADPADGPVVPDTAKGPPPQSMEEPEKLKSKKLKKYKEGAEKVLSLFASPRQS
jgi:serum/glucocorticoid-regulated kinase 2